MSGLRHLWLVPLAGCTISYLFLLAVTFGFLMPELEAAFGHYQNFGSLIFLPHAVRILAAWLYGWRSAPLLLPAVAGEHLFLYGLDEMTLAQGTVTLASVICGPLAFDVLAALGLDLRRGTGRKVKWPDLVLVGTGAAAINSLCSALFLDHDLMTTSAWFLGDVIGLIVVLLLMRGFFTLRRRVLST